MSELWKNQPQVEYKMRDAATVEYYPDPEQESETVVFRDKDGNPVMLMPTSVYLEWSKR